MTTRMTAIGWAMTVTLAAGCTADQDPAGQGETGGTSDGSETTPPEEGTDTETEPPECIDDADCGGMCGWCDQGVCEESVGCCEADVEQPGFWHCSPPVECWDDSECSDGYMCVGDECVPDPDAGLRQPPICGDEFTLAVDQFPVELRLTQVVAHEGAVGHVLAIDEEMQLHQVDLQTGEAAVAGILPGILAQELLPVGPLTSAAIVEQVSDDGEPQYQVVSLQGTNGDDIAAGPRSSGIATDAVWLGEPAEAFVAAEGRLDRWAFGPAPEALDPLVTGAYARRLAAFRATPDDAPWLGVSLPDGVVAVFDALSGESIGTPTTVAGAPLALEAIDDAEDGEGQHLVALYPAAPSQTPPDEPMAALQVIRDLEGGGADAAFGAPGIPQALVVADLDGDGIDDLAVAMDDGRLDIYRMDETDVLCRSFLPLGGIEDLTVGDVDGDGAVDIVVADAAPGLTVIHGAAPQ